MYLMCINRKKYFWEIRHFICRVYVNGNTRLNNFIIFFYSQGIFWDIWLDMKEEAVCYQSSNKKVNYHWTWLLVTNGVVGNLCHHFLFKSWVKCLLSGTLNIYIIIAFMLTCNVAINMHHDSIHRLGELPVWGTDRWSQWIHVL